MKEIVLISCLLLSAVCSVLCQAKKCNQPDFDKCLHNLKPLYNNQDGPIIVKNEQELLALCRQQQNMLSCIKNVVTNCLMGPEQNIFNNMTSGVEEFLAEFCAEESNTRRVYLKHLGCFNRLTDQVHDCTKRLYAWNKELEQRRAARDQTTLEACCRYDDAMYCMQSRMRNGCPHEAADLFDGMVFKSRKQYYQIANCDQYVYSLADCAGTQGSTSNSIFIVGLGPLVIAILSIFKQFW